MRPYNSKVNAYLQRYDFPLDKAKEVAVETDVLLEDVQSALKQDLLVQCAVEVFYRTLHVQDLHQIQGAMKLEDSPCALLHATWLHEAQAQTTQSFRQLTPGKDCFPCTTGSKASKEFTATF